MIWLLACRGKLVRMRPHASSRCAPGSESAWQAFRTRETSVPELLAGKTKAIEDAVEGPDVDAAVRDRKTAEMIERLDLIAAGIEFFSCLRIEGVQNSMGRVSDALRAVIVEAAFGIRLLGIFAIAIGKHHTISDDWRLRAIHVARHPGRHEFERIILLFEFVSHNCAMLNRTIRNRNLEIAVHRAPKRCKHPSCSGRILPACHGAPDTGRCEIDFLIAHQWSLIERSLMIFSARCSRIEQVNTTRFATGDEKAPGRCSRKSQE